MSVFDIALEYAKSRGKRRRPYGLSDRQWEIARFLREGLDCTEIAARLSTTRRNILAQRGHIRRKLNAANLRHLDYLLATIPQLCPAQFEVVDLDDFRIGFGQRPETTRDRDQVVEALHRR